jgi:Coenzyme PQQ synthesis protein D (PqqD)
MPPITPESILVAADHQVSCDVDDEAALLNLDTGVYFGLNPVGAYIWKLVQSPVTFHQLRQRLATEFPEQQENIDQDLREFLDDMVSAGLVQIEVAPD